MAKQEPVKTSTSKEVEQFYREHRVESNREPETRSTPGVRRSLGATPPYMALLIGLSLASTTIAALPAVAVVNVPPERGGGHGTHAVEPKDPHRGSGRVQDFDPGRVGAPGRSGGQETRQVRRLYRTREGDVKRRRISARCVNYALQ